MGNVRMLPPADGLHGTAAAPTVAHGRSYGAAVGTPVDVPHFDAGILQGAGWVPTLGAGVQVGPTSARPTNPLRQDGLGSPPAGTVFIDTTISAVVVFDGSTWRNSITGAAA